MSNDKQITSIDLFSGPGGLTTGLKMAGFKTLIAVELNAETVETFSANHESEIMDIDKYSSGESNYPEIFKPSEIMVLIKGDVRKVTNTLIKKILRERFQRDSVDVVTGGPPCESFSIAGKRMANDERDFLFMNISRIAKSIDAKMILFENVKGILSKKKSNADISFFSAVCDEFEKIDSNNDVSYRLSSWNKDDILLNCMNFGVPQSRERVFLVGINNKYRDVYFDYPIPTHGPNREYPYVTVEEALSLLPKVNVGEKAETFDVTNERFKLIAKSSYKQYMQFIHGDKLKINKVDKISLNSHKASKHFPKIIKRMSYILPGEGMKTASERLIAEGKREIRDEFFPEKPYGARYRRLIAGKPSFTVTSHSFDEMIHPYFDRALTPREVARLQTFPDWYIFKGPYVVFHSSPKQDRYEQIGDAVPPLMGYLLGKELVKTLGAIRG